MALMRINQTQQQEERSPLESFATVMDIGLGVANTAKGFSELKAMKEKNDLLKSAVKAKETLISGPDPLRGQDPNSLVALSSAKNMVG